MKDALNKFVEKVKNIGNIDFLGNEVKDEYKMPIMDLAFIPIGVLFFYFKKFLIFASVFAFFTAILSSTTGFNVVCNYSEFRANDYYHCSFSFGLYITFFLLRLMLTAAFLRLWCKIVVKGESISLKEISFNPFHDLKILGSLLVFVLVNIMPVVSFIALYYRVPNPDWRIEMLFFAFACIGFLLPFISVRFYSVLAFIFEDKKIPSIKEIFKRTDGSTLKILLALSIMSILFFIIFIYFNIFAEAVLGYSPLVFGFIFDILYNLLLLMFFAMVANHFVMQQGLLFGAPTEIEDNDEE